MPLEALIFDVDGTLAETEELHRQAFNDTFADQGIGWTWSRADYRRLLLTTGGKERIARHMADLGLDPASLDIPALHRAKTDRYSALMAAGGLALRDSIADLIQEARSAGLRVAIATTTSRPNVDALCAATFGLPPEAIFSAIACGDEVAAKKPSPEIYDLALERLHVTPSQAVAFEDSTNGLRSALAAGLPCIVTPSVYTAGDDFSGALAVVDSVADLGGIDGIVRLICADQPA
ncbi:HAD family hydrolase [Paracoccus subflavus]|uniref:HAD family hydrolase n=1 Tax=Paracoccus subflavus TaxID=2528244 RepID=A0A4Q9FX30_9RHOB|nr:HAD family hydrolase [Paracoccus subflavus]TBN38370.1 HAD family hydrolase [Paracoccus subflavus]